MRELSANLAATVRFTRHDVGGIVVCRALFRTAVLAALLAVGCAPAYTGSLNDVRPGDTVRVTYAVEDDARDIGRFIRYVNGRVELIDVLTGSPKQIAFGELAAFELLAGHARARGALTGFAIGSVAGLLGGMVCTSLCSNSGTASVLAPVIGMGAGGILGSAAGVSLAPRRWTGIEFR
jgi:hypothetical protein